MEHIQPQSNILSEPVPVNNESTISDELLETQSVSTIEGLGTSNYKAGLDPKLFSAQKIRCCMCGAMIAPNQSNTCINCLKAEIDISEGIPKQLNLNHCRECNRYERPPWVLCELESAELMGVCLKTMKGLKKVKLMDSNFIWTEPHSRRIKLKVTIQKEVMNGTLLQQTFIVEFTTVNKQCDECKKTYTPHLWIAQVQVRQRVDHKRTFLFLEQMLIKHNMASRAIGIKEVHDGLDFHFKSRADANRLAEFISGAVPTQVKNSKQLISSDLRNNTYHYKYSTSVEIAPVCRDDLVLLPKALSNKLGGLGPLVLVYKISTFVHIVDVYSMQTYELDQVTYWKHQFQALCGRDRLTEFVVINIDNIDYNVNDSRASIKQKFKMVQVEVQRVEDFGVNNDSFLVSCHLGEILNFNDTVLGYDLDMINMVELEDNPDLKRDVPPVVLVRKTYPKHRKKQQKSQRQWQLKHLDKETMDENNMHRKEGKHNNRHQRDYDMFLQDIEEDPELRNHIDLYEVEESKNAKGVVKGAKPEESKKNEDDESEEEDFPRIKESELKNMLQSQVAQIDIGGEEEVEELENELEGVEEEAKVSQ